MGRTHVRPALSNGVDDAIGEAVGDGFLGVQVEVAVRVLVDAVQRLAGGGRRSKFAEFEVC